MVELYRQYRPQSFDQVFGQTEAVQTLKTYLRKGNLPHSILFHGPSGTGKTTLARILQKELGCGEMDFMEINAASSRGIDTVRDIASKMGLAPLSSCRIWLLDEAHQLSRKMGGDAQTALLKMLEEAPEHVYFFLCTTHPEELLDTIRKRCCKIKVDPLSELDMKNLLAYVCDETVGKLSDSVIQQIVECSEGSAREALITLEKVISLEAEGNATEEQLLAVITPPKLKTQGIAIAREIMSRTNKWKDVARLLRECDEDPEKVRIIILNYAASILMSGKDDKLCGFVLTVFNDPFFHPGDKKARLVRCCYEVRNQKF